VAAKLIPEEGVMLFKVICYKKYFMLYLLHFIVLIWQKHINGAFFWKISLYFIDILYYCEYH